MLHRLSYARPLDFISLSLYYKISRVFQYSITDSIISYTFIKNRIIFKKQPHFINDGSKTHPYNQHLRQRQQLPPPRLRRDNTPLQLPLERAFRPAHDRHQTPRSKPHRRHSNVLLPKESRVLRHILQNLPSNQLPHHSIDERRRYLLYRQARVPERSGLYFLLEGRVCGLGVFEIG